VRVVVYLPDILSLSRGIVHLVVVGALIHAHAALDFELTLPFFSLSFFFLSLKQRLLPEPELPEEPKKDEGVVGNLKNALFGGMGGMFGANSSNAAADLAKTK